MGTAIGTSLPYAMAAALSPIPITALMLMLIAHRGITGSLFSAGRVFSYALILTTVIVASELIRPGTDVAPSSTGEIARFVLGGVSVAAGIWTWFGRSSAEKSTGSSRWMQAVGRRITPTRSAALGFALSVGPKSLLLLAGGGLVIAGARVTPAGEALAGVVFLAIASSTVLVPVGLYYALGTRGVPTLRLVQGWMQMHGAAISSVLLILVGAILIGSGIAGL